MFKIDHIYSDMVDLIEKCAKYIDLGRLDWYADRVGIGIHPIINAICKRFARTEKPYRVNTGV